jgi:hypothetical protein
MVLALFPIKEIAKVVAIDDAKMFTILFPINIAVRNSFGFFNQSFKRFAIFSFSSSTFFNFVILNPVRAVSDDEKNPDKIIKKINNII